MRMRFVMLAAAVVAFAAAGAAQVSLAQAPPTRFFGSITVDGQPATSGTPIEVEINGRACGSGSARQVGMYVADAQAEGSIAGCGQPDSVVLFKVGQRYAAETGTFLSGEFKALNLTITGTGARPVVAAQPAAVASPSPSPAGTPRPSPSPTAQTFSVAVLDLSSPCVPAAGAVVCDSARLRLWTGDTMAWTARFESQGRPAPTPDEIFTETFGFRIEAGDPAAIAAVATGMTWPHVRITGVQFRGSMANQRDEWVEVKNLGGASQDMSGWSVRVNGTPNSWRFADGFVLEPGQACRFYVGPAGANACGGASNIAPMGILDDSSGTISLWVDSLDWNVNEVRYVANPTNQPAPPNLQGAQQP
jgi:hypothetical protein